MGYHVEALIDTQVLPQRYPLTLIGYHMRLPRCSPEQLYWDARIYFQKYFELESIFSSLECVW